MQSLREAVSDIIIDLKSADLDDTYSYRFIANKLRDNIETFLKQDSVDRTILKINELWKPLHYIQLVEEVYGTNPPYYDTSQTVKKSALKIPEVYTCKYGNLIKVVNTVTGNEYIPIKSFEYKDIKNREYASKKYKYYWLEDSHIYLPDSEVDYVRAYGLFKDSQEADLFNGTTDCCYKPLDSILLLPDYIINISKKQVVADLVQEKQIVPDANPNLNPNVKV